MPMNPRIGTPPVCSRELAGGCESEPQGWEPAFPAGTAALCHMGILGQPGGPTAWNSLSRGRGCLCGHFLYSPIIAISTYPLINMNAWHLDGILVPAMTICLQSLAHRQHVFSQRPSPGVAALYLDLCWCRLTSPCLSLSRHHTGPRAGPLTSQCLTCLNRKVEIMEYTIWNYQRIK